MSRILAKNRDFVTLLLNGEPKQAKALLNTISNHQTQALVEILYNIANLASKKADKDIVCKMYNVSCIITWKLYMIS